MKIEREDSYPKTRSHIQRAKEAEMIVSAWKQMVEIGDSYDELSYMKKFDGKIFHVYQPHRGRDMHYIGEEIFMFDREALADDVLEGNKMFVIAETPSWIVGFQLVKYKVNTLPGFLRLEMNAVHK